MALYRILSWLSLLLALLALATGQPGPPHGAEAEEALAGAPVRAASQPWSRPLGPEMAIPPANLVGAATPGSGLDSWCEVGLQLTNAEAAAQERDYHMHIVQRYGVASAQAKAFVPAAALRSITRAMIARGEQPFAAAPAVPVDPGVERLTQLTLAEQELNATELPGRRRLLQTTPVTIDVFFEVLAQPDNAGYVSAATISSLVSLLTKHFSAAGFAFRLAYTTVTRVPGASWCGSVLASPDSRVRRAASRLTVFTCSSIYQSVLGQASFPWSSGANFVFITTNALPGGSDARYTSGKSLVHEVGHWLGLYHTFQGGCHPSSKSDTAFGDFISDTPPADQIFGRNDCTFRDSCPGILGPDPIHNFMDYSTDDCRTSFTPQQNARMRGMWAAYRAPLEATTNVLKRGNDGTVNCTTFCRGAGWGTPYLRCTRAADSWPTANTEVLCDDQRARISSRPRGAELQCWCAGRASVKHGNDGSVSCAVFCTNASFWATYGAGWGPQYSECISAYDTSRTIEQSLMTCDKVRGPTTPASEVTCYCAGKV